MLDKMGQLLLPLLSRLVFCGVLLMYFWSSALTKFDGPFSFSFGAFTQIFPHQMEAVSYDANALGIFYWIVVALGSYAEIILPLLIAIGLLTRLSALGMIGFILVQSLTDIYGHGIDAQTIGKFFDRNSGALVDQRAYWVLGLLILVFQGAGPISLDTMFKKRKRL